MLEKVSRRGLVLGFSACAAGLLLPLRAHAGLARPIALSELVRTSRHSVVGIPREAFSRWEVIGRGRRIVTHTRLGVDRLVSGAQVPDGELWVRTIGGRVGNIGQVVEGEAVLRLGERALVFVTPSPDSVLHVTALAQGHYPLRADAAGVERLMPSPRLSALLKGEQSAVRTLVGRKLVEAIDLVQQAGR
jgi:hypothetical protein